jgi:hypothetical protein
MSLRYDHRHYYSVHPLKDGTMVFRGGESRKDSDWTPYSFEDRYTIDDSTHNSGVMRNSIAGFFMLTYGSASKISAPSDEQIFHVWIGIVRETANAVPLSGPIDGLNLRWF